MNYCNFKEENALELKRIILQSEDNFNEIVNKINMIKKYLKDLLANFCDVAASEELSYFNNLLNELSNKYNHVKYELENTPTKTTITEVYKDYNGENKTIFKEIPINQDLIYDLKQQLKELDEKIEECKSKIEFLEYYVNKYSSLKKYLLNYCSILETNLYLLKSEKDKNDEFSYEIIKKIDNASNRIFEFETMTTHYPTSFKNHIKKIK